MLKSWVSKSRLHLLYALLIALFLATLSSIAIYLLLSNKNQVYSDIVVGSITWIDYYKNKDYFVILGFIFIFTLLFIILNRVLNNFNLKALTMLSQKKYVDDYISFTCFIMIFSLFLTIFSKGNYLFFSIYITVIPLITSIVIKLKINNNQRSFLYWCTILCVIFTYMSTSAIIIFVSLFSYDLPELFKYLPAVISGSISAIAILLLLFHGNLEFILIRRIILLLQIPIPLIILSRLAVNYHYNDSFISVSSLNLKIITYLFVCLLLTMHFIHFIKIKKTTENKWEDLVSVSTIISIAYMVTINQPVVSTLFNDDFHMGEIILPWHQIIKLGQGYNTEFVSIQGLLGIFYGGINELLLDGTVSTFALSLVLAPCIIGMLIAYIIYKLYGPKWALMYVVFYLPVVTSSYMSRFFLVIPIIMILFHSKLLSKPINWILAWIWLSAFHCFFNPTIGAALTIGSLPLGVYIIVKIFKNNLLIKLWNEQRLRFILCLSLQFLLLFLLMPAMLGTINYLIDNSSTNAIAYGIGLFGEYQTVPEWFPQWFPSHLVNRFFWESIRIGGWVGSLLFVLWISYKLKMESYKNPVFYFYTIFVFIFILLVSSYGLGRINPESLNRSGSLSILCLAGLVPYSLFLIYQDRKPQIKVIVLLASILGIVASFVNFNSVYDIGKLIEPIEVSDDMKFINGEDKGLPALGNMFIDDNRYTEIVNIKYVIDKVVLEGETFLDLTNRSMIYFILDKKVPSLYSADYVASNYKIQNRFIASLEKYNIPIVFIGPSIRHDGGPSSLRSYRIYKYLMEIDFEYYEYKGLQFMVRKDRLEHLNVNGISRRENAEKLSEVFSQKNLNSIPIAWGRNLSNINRFEEGNYKIAEIAKNQIITDEEGWNMVNGSDPFYLWQISKSINGMFTDFISFELLFKRVPNKPFNIQLFWDIDGKVYEENSFVLKGYNGEYLIPVGSNPNWLLNKAITIIRLDVDGIESSSRFQIKNLKFLKLIK